MSFGRTVKRRLKSALPPAFFLSLVAYFAWNANQGEHGLKSYSGQLVLLSQAQVGQVAALSEQAAWSQRVSGLRDRAMDADTLDERSRAMLNLAEPEDIVVPYGQNRKLY
jgi:cell division protein FtsB